jgi:proteasome component ECM29
MSTEHRNLLINILVTGLNGRTWNGKENLLKALATICSSCKYVYRCLVFVMNIVMKL